MHLELMIRILFNIIILLNKILIFPSLLKNSTSIAIFDTELND